MNDARQVSKAVARAKRTLRERAARRGISENFGATQVRALRERFAALQYGDPYERQAYATIIAFSEWCMTYTGRTT